MSLRPRAQWWTVVWATPRTAAISFREIPCWAAISKSWRAVCEIARLMGFGPRSILSIVSAVFERQSARRQIVIFVFGIEGALDWNWDL